MSRGNVGTDNQFFLRGGANALPRRSFWPDIPTRQSDKKTSATIFWPDYLPAVTSNTEVCAPTKPPLSARKKLFLAMKIFKLRLRRKLSAHYASLPYGIRKFNNIVATPFKKMGNIALPAVAILLFFVGLTVSLQSNQTIQQVDAQAQGFVNESGGQYSQVPGQPIPDEKQPDEKTFGMYVTSPDTPRYLRINRFGVNARVIRVGIIPNGEMAAPHNVFDVGWYTSSSKPGAQGAMLVGGHVSGPTRNGSLYNLKKMDVGDIIEIEKGDGTRLGYRVVGKEAVNRNNVDMQKAMRSADPSKPGLNVITCAGRYNRVTQQFDDRVIVYTVLD